MGYKVAQLLDQVGKTFGPSAPKRVDQARIDSFAEVTGDHQWIHVDEAKARTEGPFGGTIAHGYLVLSMVAGVVMDLGLFPDDAAAVMNYGVDRVRFTGIVPAGTDLCVTAQIAKVEDKGNGRFLLTCACTVTPVGAEKPVVVADTLALVMTG